MSKEERLAEDARRSREETRELREEAADADKQDHEPDGERDREPSPKEPWAKTSSGDADRVTTDD
jgi:hypothetical protein